jgi:hypothetical protein
MPSTDEEILQIYLSHRETLGDFKNRFHYECIELDDRISRLETYLKNIPNIEYKEYKQLLTKQLKVMKELRDIYDERIQNNFLI